MEDEGTGWRFRPTFRVELGYQPWAPCVRTMPRFQPQLVILILVLMCVVSVYSMCPAKCNCQDDKLRVSCAEAGLAVVPIQLNPELQEIDLHENRIANVDYTLQIYEKLRVLDISCNKIGHLGKHNFELQDKLFNLNISHNQISALKKGVFKGLKSLRFLDLSYNELQEIEHSVFHDTVYLEEIDLSKNRITSFHEESIFKTLKFLRILSLSGNEILEIPSTMLKHLPNPSLEIIELSNNLIEILEERSFPTSTCKNLQVLKLSSNVINEVHSSCFNALHSLTYLDLSYNNLSNVPTDQLSKLSRLAELKLNANSFTVVPAVAFQSLFQLKYLQLSSMPFLQSIEPRAFVDNIHLETVIMDDNKYITRLPSRLFYGNPHLVNISIRRNSLTTLDDSHFPKDQLRFMDISGNPFNCNCSLFWLWKLAKREADQRSTSVESQNGSSSYENDQVFPLRLNIDDLRCAAPETLRGSLITDISESSVRCETTWMTVAVVTSFVLALFVAFCIILLMIGTEHSFWTCGRNKEQSHNSATESRRLAAGPPVLMLMPDKQGYVDPWPPLPINNEYNTNTSRKQPHIVYV